MVEQAPNVVTEREAPEEEGSGGLDIESLRDTVGFVLRATRRRPVLALLTFVTIAALGVTVAITMPRTYSSQVTLLAQRSAVRALTGQNTQIEDNPTKNVAAMIMRRDNVVALAKEANLVRRFDETRPAALRLKDRIMTRLFGSLSDADKLNILVLTLEKKLDVTVTDDSTVTITVDWSNPQIAYDLATLVQKNFLEARYDSDVAVINDSIAVLEEHAKSELAHVDTELDEYQKIVAARSGPATASPLQTRFLPGTTTRVLMPAGTPAATPADADLAKELEEKRVQIRALEDARQRSLEALKTQLSTAQLTLTPMHPTVIALQQQVDAMSEPSAELAQLRGEERSLMDRIAAPKAEASAAPRMAILPRRPSASPTDAPSATDSASAGGLLPPLTPAALERDGPLQLAQSELALAIRAYEDALVRLDATKVELDITGAAYKHRYTVVTPAELPKSPKKATAQLVGVGAVFGGALLALLIAAGMDMVAGLVLESWQVRRRLRLDVLGELDNPS